MKSRISRFLVISFSVLLVLVLGGVVLLYWLLDGERLEDELQARLARDWNLEVEMGGLPRPSLLGGFSLRLSDLEISQDGNTFASVEALGMRTSLRRILNRDARPTAVFIRGIDLELERLEPGVFSVQLPERDQERLDEWSINRLIVRDARLHYHDQVSGRSWTLEDCGFRLRSASDDGGYPVDALASLTGQGRLRCDRVSRDRLEITDVRARFEADDQRFDLHSITATLFDGEFSGEAHADFSSSPPSFTATGALSAFDFGAFMGTLDEDSRAEGRIDLDVELQGEGARWRDVRASSRGHLQLRAEDLLIEGVDLDNELDSFAETQRFNLIDVGAVFLAGPIGLAASRGYAFTGMLDGGSGQTRIGRMRSDWTIESGHARADDVAFRTDDNRLALTGALDFNDYRFDDIKVAVLDGDGCAVIDQAISGTFDEPEIDTPNIIEIIAGPVLDLVERGVDAVAGSDCEPFYLGNISHP
ncbi:MAG: AsmA family protein [Wenzhouxiangella sp.]